MFCDSLVVTFSYYKSFIIIVLIDELFCDKLIFNSVYSSFLISIFLFLIVVKCVYHFSSCDSNALRKTKKKGMMRVMALDF